MNNTHPPFHFNPERQYICASCGSEATNVISDSSLFCDDCRNMTSPSELMDKYVRLVAKLSPMERAELKRRLDAEFPAHEAE
jgi:hypothetical protein